MATLLMTFVFEDSVGVRKTLPIHWNESSVDTLAKAQGVITSLAPLFSAVSGCEVVGATATFPVTVPADAGGSDPGYRVDAGATLSFENASGNSESYYIPGFLLSRMSGNAVDANNADVAALIAAFVAGTGITGGYAPTDADEIDLVAYRRGKKTTRKT